MDKVDRYRQIVIDIVRDYQQRGCSFAEIETYCIIDHEGDHYQVMRDGWRNNYRHYGPVLHFDIKEGKIWVRHNGTEHDIAAMLVERGVAKEDIVLAFHSPSLRKYTEYATC